MDGAGGCFHCGLPIPAGSQWRAEVDGVARALCCPGCQAVAETIAALGQTDYYRTRTGPAAQAAVGGLPAALTLYDGDDYASRFGAGDGASEALFTLDGIRCAACVWLIEKRMRAVAGVLEANVNVAAETLTVRWDSALCKPSVLLAAVRQIGYMAYPYDAERHGAGLRKRARTLFRQLFVAGLAMMQVMMYAFPAYIADDGTLDADMAALMRWASLLLTTPVVAYSALPFFQGAWAGLRARTAGMDLPVAIGIACAFGASVAATVRGSGEVYFDSVTMFAFLLLCSRYLELAARRKAAGAAERLQHGLPASAHLLPLWPADSAPAVVACASLAIGDKVLVKPGEATPADGMLLSDAAVDLSLLTGESAAQQRSRGDLVPGGALNAGSAFVLEITHAARDSTLARLVKLVERAGQSRPRIALWADRVGAWFVAALLLVALAALLIWQAIDPARAWPIAIAVLVVSCPCALSLATPTVLAAATDRLLGKGVLITRGHVLETLARATHVVFDKTGTLTQGTPVVADVVAYTAMSEANCRAVAAALSQASAHPASRALAANGDGVLPASQVTEIAGRGLEGSVAGGRYRLGNADFVAELTGPLIPRGASGTTVFLGCEFGLLAHFSLRDEVRSDAADVLARLRADGKQIVLLSGDDDSVVQAVAAQLGIETAVGNCLPEQKLDYIRTLQSEGAVVAMVGDGLNDAAALEAADVSFAMRRGAALAHAHASAVLLSEQLSALSATVHTARKTMRLIRQNLSWAMVYNAVAIPAAALGWLNPWLSGVGMAASSAFVVANALRVRRD
ncbi:MAG TPA: heavy metal translocating P-type ATPase [Burkholderiaceae bacterium]